jgi:translation initiation factor 2B subunit (eIF-2B alpha/beta/delta family)
MLFLFFSNQAKSHFLVFLLQAKLDLLSKIDNFRNEVDLAGEAISLKAAEKISDKDVIMVYGW